MFDRRRSTAPDTAIADALLERLAGPALARPADHGRLPMPGLRASLVRSASPGLRDRLILPGTRVRTA